MDDSSSVGPVESFNYIYFMRFLSNNNVLPTAIAAVLSERISDLTHTFVDNIIMAVINRDADGDGVKDIVNLEKQSVKLYGVKFGVGKVVLSLLKFIIVTYTLFLVSKIISKTSKHKYTL